MIEIRVLGPVAVEVDSTPADLTSPKLRRLLAVLAATPNDVVSNDRLIDWVWSDTEPDQAVRTLRTHMWRLRNVLKGQDGDYIVTQPPGYRLALAVDELDALAFERDAGAAQRTLALGRTNEAIGAFDVALARWRGEAFGEFARRGMGPARGGPP